MQEIRVRNVIIGKQFEDSENYQKFLKLVKERNVKVHMVEAGKRINIEKDLYFDVLWPSSKQVISENGINNNSLVCQCPQIITDLATKSHIALLYDKVLLNAR